MWKKLYWTFRPRVYNNSISLNDISLNWWYDTKFFNWWQFRDYEEAWITKLTQPIPNDRFIWTIPKIDRNEQVIWTVPKLTRFVMLEYSDVYTNSVDLTKSVTTSSSDTVVDIFATPADAITRIKANTDLVEKTPWVFIIRDAYTDTLTNQVVPEELLVID